MKTKFFLYLIFALSDVWAVFYTSAVEANSLRVVVIPSKTNVRVKEAFRVALRMENPTTNFETVRVMCCSWFEEWQISDPNISWLGWDCPKNFPLDVGIPPGGAYTNELAMVIPQAIAQDTFSFRMGFTSIGGGKTFWSDDVKLHVLSPTSGNAPGDDFRFGSYQAPFSLVTNPPASDAGPKTHFEYYLSQCDTNEVRCLWFLGDNPKVGMVITVSLNKDTVFTVREVFDWAEQGAKKEPLSLSTHSEIKNLIPELPASDKSAAFAGSVFIAARTDGPLKIYQYNRRHPPEVMRRIYDLGGGYFYDGIYNP